MTTDPTRATAAEPYEACARNLMKPPRGLHGRSGGTIDRSVDDHGNCWTCGDRPPHRFRYLIHAKGRLRWAAKTARHAEPKTFAARLRLLWHDFVIHGLLHRGGERCEDCGRGYPNWHADDAEWQRVMGGPWGTLCERCFTVRARIAVALIVWLRP